MHEAHSRLTAGGKLSFRRRIQRVPEAPQGELPLVLGGIDPPRLSDLVPARAYVEVEVGPGKGTFLLAATEARPDSFWLGIEAAQSYAELGASRLAAAGRKNGLLLADNAALFLRDRCDAGRVARLHVYFPDPWPKRKHRGRRFFAACPPPVLRRVLADDGVLFVATDNAGYAGEIVRVLGDSPLFARDEALEAELRERPGEAFSPTNFERKYLAQGRIVRRYAWRVADGE